MVLYTKLLEGPQTGGTRVPQSYTAPVFLLMTLTVGQNKCVSVALGALQDSLASKG